MIKILPSTIQLLRFPFSFFLMPVYWFALSQITEVSWIDALLVFVILHVLVYPASNGYNSFIDRDTSPIGGVASPMLPQQQLLSVTYVLNAAAVGLSFFITPLFAILISAYIVASLAYSSRRIRLKKYPVLGYLTVVTFQGALTFYLVFHGSGTGHPVQVPVWGMVAAGLLIGGFYPLTQIYQHEADRRDGVRTISMLLGYKGTFIFTGIIYAFAFLSLAYLFYQQSQMMLFVIFQLFLLPVLLYFFYWLNRVRRNAGEANFRNTMRMNILASVCTNLGFITIIIVKYLE